jgi:cyclohexa-1,5-dienecarbonyl-CoA hydratase
MPSAENTSRVEAQRHGEVARLTLNRPPLNILDLAALRELRAAVEAAAAEPAVRLIEIRGAGEKAFCAGMEVRDHFPERAPEMLREFHALVRALLYAPRPTLAVVRGHCLGGGMELAMACDFIVAAPGARFGQPEIKLGAFPPVAAALLPRLIGEKKALEMILTGEPISAEEAQRWGLVNRVAAGDLEAEAEKFSQAILASSSRVGELARRAARFVSRQSFESALREAERIYLEELLPSEDAREGLEAFLAKRPPAWKGK